MISKKGVYASKWPSRLPFVVSANRGKPYGVLGWPPSRPPPVFFTCSQRAHNKALHSDSQKLRRSFLALQLLAAGERWR